MSTSAMNLDDRVTLEPDGNGTVLATFPDVPEAVTFGEEEEALLRAVDALETAEFYLDHNRDLRRAVKPKRGQRSVRPSALACAELAISQTMRDQGVRKSGLARRPGLHMPQVDRLLDLRHASRLDQAEAALRVLGKDIEVRLADAAQGTLNGAGRTWYAAGTVAVVGPAWSADRFDPRFPEAARRLKAPQAAMPGPPEGRLLSSPAMSAPPPFPRALLAPRHWPAWVAVGCIHLLVLLPARWVVALGAAFGALVSPLLRERRRVVGRNLELCFPELDARGREALRREATREMGRMLGEFALGWFASDAKLAHLPVRIEGMEHLERARASGRGVLLVGGHFSHLELCARLISRRIRIAGMYRRMDSAVFEYAVLRARLGYADAMFDKDQLRATVKYLKRGGTVWYAPDQDMRGKDSVFAPFFGIPASTITATHHLARLSGAAVMPFFHRRDAHGGYVLRLEAPLADFPTDDVVADTARVNTLIERMAREAPAQYLWAHKRFKTRPAGMATVYGSRDRGPGTGDR